MTAQEPQKLPRVCRYNGSSSTAAFTVYERVRRNLIHTTGIGEVRLVETRVAVASDLDGFPLSESGVPKLGLFPHSATHQPPASSTSYQISVAALDLTSGELLISVQASVMDGSQVEHGAWPVGIRFREPGNPATYFSISVPDRR